ncbi:MAG: DEAD/DEAH box helicase [Treponema sp.]|jgi:ATP-dependent RNA helicase RhlB|nr:DEAD/DEAH box helicase [Treponema sp.]
MEFTEFNLHPELQRGIADAGYVSCMPVQEQVLASAFSGRDMYVQSQTGTGKTAAFLVVIFQRLLAESLLGGKKALVMVPTRELAVQVEEEAKVLGKYLPFKTGSFYGGVGYAQQQRLLKDNVQILVGTPGRVLDLNKSGQMNLMNLAFLVIDEADRMFDMGFYPDLRKLISVVPPADRRQTMLFSATLNSRVKNLAWEYTKDPLEIEIEPESVTVEEVEQVLYHVHSADKMRLLLGIMEREKPESAIIFCNTKRYAEIVAKRLRVNGIDCEFIIGDLPQVKRLKIIDDVKNGTIKILVATDVAARGLDIESLALVVNYDLPVEAENYVHRIGRTARAGKTGKAVTLASEQDVYELPDIEKYIGKKISSQIAGEDLLAGDKSEGLRIRTDFYDDRNDKRGGRKDSRGTGGRPAERTLRAGGSGEGGRSPVRSGPGRKSAADSPHRESGGRARKDRAAPPVTERSGPRLSELSLEERMAYYKEKYGGRRQTGGGPRDIRENGRQRKNAGQRRRDPAESAGQAGRKAGADRGRRENFSRERQKTEAPKTSGPAAAEKQGFVGKLLGMFKKKK